MRALVAAELARADQVRALARVCIYMQTGPARPWCLHLHANRPRALELAPWSSRPPGRAPGGQDRPPPTPGPEKRALAQAAPALARFHTLGFT